MLLAVGDCPAGQVEDVSDAAAQRAAYESSREPSGRESASWPR